MTQLCTLPEKGMMTIIPLMDVLDIDVLIGRNLKRIREKNNLSQAQLAEMIGTTPQRLSAYETGRDGMGKDYMERVCRAFNIQPWEFYWTKQMPVVKDDHEKEALERYRREQASGVAEEVARYGEFRIEESKKKNSTPQKDAVSRSHRIARKKAS